MKKENMKIVCFGSGDFPIETFEYLVKYNNVVGFVTSNDKPVFGDKRVYDLAEEYGIPVYIPKSLEDDDFLNWLDEIDGNIYCVISYKYLPKCVTQKSKYSFNVHASLLPLLRGAAPINWALRYGFERTGLSVIKLADKIDTGGIVATYGVDIDDNDTYESLFKKLADASVLLVDSIMQEIEDDTFGVHAEQPQVPNGYDSEIFHAPKLTLENTTYHQYTERTGVTAREIYNMIRSLSPNIGTTFNLTIRKWVKSKAIEFGGEFVDVKEITFKVYDAKLVNKGSEWIEEHYDGSHIITDWKNYLYIISQVCEDEIVSVKTIQLPGKKILDIKDFLKGFQVYNKPEHNFFLN
jgi:methionyl-tRNA formyltransferase